MDDAQVQRLVELLRAEIRSEVQAVVRAQVGRVETGGTLGARTPADP